VAKPPRAFDIPKLTSWTIHKAKYEDGLLCYYLRLLFSVAICACSGAKSVDTAPFLRARHVVPGYMRCARILAVHRFVGLANVSRSCGLHWPCLPKQCEAGDEGWSAAERSSPLHPSDNISVFAKCSEQQIRRLNGAPLPSGAFLLSPTLNRFLHGLHRQTNAQNHIAPGPSMSTGRKSR